MGPSIELSTHARSTSVRHARTATAPARQGPLARSSKSRDNFDDVADMFCVLGALDEASPAFHRQRDLIIRRCLPLADNVARRFRDRGEAHEDLVQVARLGLVKAVDRFDVSSGSNFLAFAVPTVMGEVRRYFRDHGWALKVPRRLKELGAELNAAKFELTQLLNRAPTASELAAHLGIAREEVVEALIAANAYSTRSTDLSIGSEGDEHTIANSFGELDPNIEKVLDVHAVRPLLDALPDRDRMIITLRFFENMTQTEIAGRLGISQMHVSRLLARALSDMRERLS